MSSRPLLTTGAGLAALAFASTVAAAPIYSNNAAPGDAFTNAGAANQGQAVGATGWYYNNVRNGGAVGIADTLPQSGNGSVYFGSPSGTAKADIEYLAGGVALGGNYFASASLGAFADLASFGYDWYRDSASTAALSQLPALRVLIDADGDLGTTGDRGGLVFEEVYNGNSVVSDAWVTELVTSSTYLWNFGLGLGFAANINASAYAYDATLAEWQAYLPNAVILGFSSGVGSGWNGVFAGAVDNVNWTLGNQTVSNNFEVPGAVPEPATLALSALGLAGLAGVRRRRR